MEILVTGLNHRRAPVELREKLAVAEADLPSAVAALQSALGAAEAVLLSTCNRVELYAVHEPGAPDPATVTGALAARCGVPAETLEPVLYRHYGTDAVRHLFRVASGLDSMVLGEPQITGQVKDAYVAAKEAGTTARVLNRLFQQALHTAKRIRTETSIGEKNVSVPSVASRLAEQIFHDLSARRIVILGAGETGELTTEAFRTRGVSRMHVVNRTVENARALAERWGGEAHGLDELPKVLPLGDIVLTSIASDRYILSPEDLKAALEVRRQEPMFLIDIAVPRNVNPAANTIENVYLFNIDDLESIAQQNLLEREQEASRCEPILEEETSAFLRDTPPPDTTRLLTDVRRRLEGIAEEELHRTLSRLEGLTPAQKQEVVEMNRRLVNKFLHPPSETLRRTKLDGRHNMVVELIRKLFGLKK